MVAGMRRTVLALAALALPLAACGDDSEALSKAEFQRQGNAVCKEGDAQLSEKGKKLTRPDGQPPPNAEALAAWFREDAVPAVRTQLDGLDRLDPPEGDRKKVERMLAAGRQAIDKVEQDPVVYFSAKGPDPFEEFNRLAGDLGLHDCTGPG
jgi:hypothetical protein